MDFELNDTFYDITTPLTDFGQDSLLTDYCPQNTYIALNYITATAAAFGIVFTLTTLLSIACHRRLRKKHNIFPFNIVLADFLLDVAVMFGCIVLLNNIPDQGWLLLVTFTVFQASQMVSSGSVFLVALDQFIIFKLDPFGVRRILTKSHRILISLLSWMTMLIVATCVVLLLPESPNARCCFVNLSAIFTGVFYFLVYRAIARKSPLGNSQVRKRREENMRVLKTYSIIFGTNLVLSTFPDVTCFVFYYNKNQSLYICAQVGWGLMVTLNTIANTSIYWWRLREFRAIFTCYTMREQNSIT